MIEGVSTWSLGKELYLEEDLREECFSKMNSKFRFWRPACELYVQGQ